MLGAARGKESEDKVRTGTGLLEQGLERGKIGNGFLFLCRGTHN